MPQTQIVRSRIPSSVMISRMVRMASGSPHPGQRWCWVERSSSGLAETFLSGVLMSRGCLALVGLGDLGDDVRRLERGTHAEARMIVADAADGHDRDATEDCQTDVVAH